MKLVSSDDPPQVVVSPEVFAQLENRGPIRPWPGGSRVTRGRARDRLLKRATFSRFPGLGLSQKDTPPASPALIRSTRLYRRLYGDTVGK